LLQYGDAPYEKLLNEWREWNVAEQGTPDLAWGVGEIAAVVQRDERATYHLLAKGELPARKVGGRWVASKARLLAFLTGQAA
jgi:hypothetical protein